MDELTAGLVDALVKEGYRAMVYGGGFLVQDMTNEAAPNPIFFEPAQVGWPQSDGSWWNDEDGSDSGSGDEN